MVNLSQMSSNVTSVNSNVTSLLRVKKERGLQDENSHALWVLTDRNKRKIDIFSPVLVTQTNRGAFYILITQIYDTT